MNERFGLLNLDATIVNLKPNENHANCITALSSILGRKVTLQELNDFIESDKFSIIFLDENDCVVDDICCAYKKRFKLPWKSKLNEDVFGDLKRSSLDERFVGVFWVTFNNRKLLFGVGYVDEKSYETLEDICQQKIDGIDDVLEAMSSDIVYLNGAGYSRFPDGTMVTREYGKFAKFETKLLSNGTPVFGWFVKTAPDKYNGIYWGTESDFEETIALQSRFHVGRLIFETIEKYKYFLKEFRKELLEESWEFNQPSAGKLDSPILKSYLEFELERLFFEKDNLGLEGKIVYNSDNTKAFYNTNLIDVYGNEVYIVGDIEKVAGKEYLRNPQKVDGLGFLRAKGFEGITRTSYGFNKGEAPVFFTDINEIFYHSEWSVDFSTPTLKHIIDQRRYRFPQKYRDLSAAELSIRLNNAFEFAKQIAKRNYKFVVPMYYPRHNRIQLLMPIYLECNCERQMQPDFALVLTPKYEGKEPMYDTETILGLQEVYQDARLIAKPGESWINSITKENR